MRIYRILNKYEYRCFSKYQDITNYNQSEYNPCGMLFPENIDAYGKFFFFELEDIYNFVHHFSNATSNDAILELDIDRETALKYLLISDYYYVDPTKGSLKLTREEIENIPEDKRCLFVFNHYILELFLDHNLVGSKIKNGEYRIIPGQSILEYENHPNSYYETDRNPKALELACHLNKVREIRQDIRSAKYGLSDSSDRYYKLINGEVEPTEPEKLMLAKLKTLNENLSNAIEDTKAYFIEFAREHEKYMALVPVPEESQPE